MLSNTHWVAVIRDGEWTVAKVLRKKSKLIISQLNTLKAPALSSPEFLSRWFKSQHVSLKKLKFALSCPGVITRIITLPALKPKDMQKLLTENVDQYFTLNISEYLVDYQVIENFKEDNQPRQRVLLAAVPKYQWEPFWSFCREAGFSPRIVDLTLNSQVRLYSYLGKLQAGKKGSIGAETKDIAILDLNEGRAEIILLNKGVFFLYSDLEFILDDLEFFREELALSDSLGEAAPSLEGSSDRFVSDQPFDLHEGTTNSIAIFKAVLQQREKLETALNGIIQNLMEFLNFFAARHFGKTVDTLYITGELSDLPYLTEIFSSALEVPTIIGFPNGWLPTFQGKTKSVQSGRKKYGSLYGLALRED